MAGKQQKRTQKKTYKQARIEAEARARRRQHRRRQVITLASVAAAVVIIAGVVLFTGGDNGQEVATDPGASTFTTAGSSAGKPCVPVADQLPAGAPAVPLDVGAPPAQLVKRDLREGTGAEVTATSMLTVHYIGVACSTGKIFDSSYERGQPATFALSGVIKGWQDGIPGMKVGGQRLLGIPADQAYGPVGSPPDIAADEPLWFVVEIVGIT
ncbi:MAG: FKBP-type peptidyl-prolyl cis-trans isomerase [Acidimicrobiales bacterium]